MSGRIAVVNADDFGLSDGVNRGIIEAHVRGIVTSASLMVRQPAAARAAEAAREHGRLALGLHVDLGEWTFDGEWVPLYSVVDTDDGDAVAREVAAQVDTFLSLVGVTPTHLDSHQHVHRTSPAREAIEATAASLSVPLRDVGIRYVGDFYGQLGTGAPYHEAITVDALIALLRVLPEGVSEIACHPGYDDGLATMYRSEREMELRVLCDTRVRVAVDEAGIELRSFAELQ